MEPYVIIESDRQLCRAWADVCHQVRQSGRKIQTADAWIAATALLYGVPLVTHNADDFAGVPGLIIISESDK